MSAGIELYSLPQKICRLFANSKTTQSSAYYKYQFSYQHMLSSFHATTKQCINTVAMSRAKDPNIIKNNYAYSGNIINPCFYCPFLVRLSFLGADHQPSYAATKPQEPDVDSPVTLTVTTLTKATHQTIPLPTSHDIADSSERVAFVPQAYMIQGAFLCFGARTLSSLAIVRYYYRVATEYDPKFPRTGNCYSKCELVFPSFSTALLM
jgi:hypothetical protein